jgi:hypothetical protein
MVPGANPAPSTHKHTDFLGRPSWRSKGRVEGVDRCPNTAGFLSFIKVKQKLINQ